MPVDRRAVPLAARLTRTAAVPAPPSAPGRGGRGRPLVGAVESAVLLVALLAVCLLAVRYGATAGQALRAVLAVLLTQVLPGAVLWRLVRPVRGWWAEDLALGFAVGSVLAALTQAVAGTLGAGWLSLVTGPLLAAVLLAVPATRARVAAVGTEPLPLGWTAAVAASMLAFLMLTVTELRVLALDFDGFARTFVDAPFHLALAGELAHRGPAAMPHVVDEPLAYHWFSHAWVAQVAVAGAVPLDVVLLRLLPVLFVLAVPFAAAAAAVRLSGQVWAGPLGAAFAALAGSLDVLGTRTAASPVSHLSPSLSMSVPVTLALLALLAARWRGGARAGAGPLLVVLAFGAAAVKGSALPVLVAGAGLAAAVLVVARSPLWRRVALDAGLLAGSLVLAYVLVFQGGGAGGLALAPEPFLQTGLGRQVVERTDASGWLVVLLVAALVLVALLGPVAGAVGLLVHAGRWHDPVGWLVLGTAFAGVAAAGLFVQPGSSQVYFLRNGAALGAAGAAAGLVLLLRRVPLRGAVLGGGAALLAAGLGGWAGTSLLGELPAAQGDGLTRAWGAIAVLLCLAALLAVAAAAAVGGTGRGATALLVLVATLSLAGPLGTARTQMARPVGAPYEAAGPSTQVAFSRDQVEAARWLRDRSHRHDLVASNRHCTRPVPPVAQPEGECDARRFFVAAYTERRVLVEGWSYTTTNANRGGGNQGGAFWRPDLLELNDGFIERPTAEGAEALAGLGVRWVFVDKTGPHAGSLEPFARLRHETAWAAVYELPSAEASTSRPPET